MNIYQRETGMFGRPGEKPAVPEWQADGAGRVAAIRDHDTPEGRVVVNFYSDSATLRVPLDIAEAVRLRDGLAAAIAEFRRDAAEDSLLSRCCLPDEALEMLRELQGGPRPDHGGNS